jgi:hypothetical protein
MVSRWNVRCLSYSRTDIYEVRTPHDIRSIHAIYLIAFLLASNTDRGRLSVARFDAALGSASLRSPGTITPR